VLALGCGDDDRPGDAGVARGDGGRDSGRPRDGGGPPDGGSDAGAPDAGTDAGACAEDIDCDDLDVCTGGETCAGGACVAGVPLECDDGDACTADRCDAILGCQSTFVDEDRDGHAPSTLGESCLDCDDGSASRHPGAPDRICDGLDSDCDGTTDEEGFVPWYADCDADGIAPLDAETTLSCATPAMPPAGCTTSGGSWSMFAPGTFTDCRDDLADVRPGTGSFFTMPIPGEPAATDYAGPGGMWECNASLVPRTQDCR
jgi:hypothetical protein